MKDDILEKIKTKLTESCYSESDVVYLLVQIYKILERENKLSNYKIINLYRNWVCHSYLNRKNELLLDSFNGILNQSMNDNVDEDLLCENLKKSIHNFSFERLKEDLCRFLQEYFKVDDIQIINWQLFRESLYNVLADQELKIKAGESKEIFFSYSKNQNSVQKGVLNVGLNVGRYRVFGTYHDSIIEEAE